MPPVIVMVFLRCCSKSPTVFLIAKMLVFFVSTPGTWLLTLHPGCFAASALLNCLGSGRQDVEADMAMSLSQMPECPATAGFAEKSGPKQNSRELNKPGNRCNRLREKVRKICWTKIYEWDSFKGWDQTAKQ